MSRLKTCDLQSNSITQENIESRIFVIRGKRVMIDRDLAELYGVETKYLNRQVRRNIERFPQSFMFPLTPQEKEELVTNWHRFKSAKHSSFSPYGFTEHGVAMLASVLKSRIAVQISIRIIEAFVRLREWQVTHKDLVKSLINWKEKQNGMTKRYRLCLKPFVDL